MLFMDKVLFINYLQQMNDEVRIEAVLYDA